MQKPEYLPLPLPLPLPLSLSRRAKPGHARRKPPSADLALLAPALRQGDACSRE